MRFLSRFSYIHYVRFDGFHIWGISDYIAYECMFSLLSLTTSIIFNKTNRDFTLLHSLRNIRQWFFVVSSSVLSIFWCHYRDIVGRISHCRELKKSICRRSNRVSKVLQMQWSRWIRICWLVPTFLKNGLKFLGEKVFKNNRR